MNVKLSLFGYTIARLDVDIPTSQPTVAAAQPVLDTAVKGLSGWWISRMMR